MPEKILHFSHFFVLIGNTDYDHFFHVIFDMSLRDVIVEVTTVTQSQTERKVSQKRKKCIA